jgi:sugar lactone lactonase YvrE
MLPPIGGTLRVRTLATLIATTIAAALTALGCSAHSPSSTGSSLTGPPLTGSVTVTIAPPPGGLLGDVNVEAASSNYSTSLTATGTIVGLPPGQYAVIANPTWFADPIVNTIYLGTVSGSPVIVTVNDTAKASATYAMQAGTGGLWVANSGSSQGVDRYSSAQLSKSAAAASTTSLGTGDPRPFGVAFDAPGNLWVALSHGNLIAEYAVSQLSTTNLAATAAFTLDGNGGALSQPAGLAFDGNGNLWVANAAANTVVEFSASQLAPGGTRSVGPSGNPAAFVTIAASAGSLDGPLGIAFDFNNNLWVANGNGGTVVEFAAGQLAASGTPTPAVSLRDTAGSIVGPIGIAFDAAGDLWVANGNTGHNTVVMFAAGQLTASGAPIPSVVLSANAGSLASPAGLAFDNSQNLWVANAAAPTVVQFTPQQVAASGSPVPNVVVGTRASSLGLPVGVAFDPYPGALPILQCIPPPNDPWDNYCPTASGRTRVRKR